ncbi:leucine--tRNA ligase [Sulfolobus acidocaldarius]|uniref:Leucine--tRNA ligase 2 n=4 Tax=Sulfolobus acidocaldarius TaxID=2285 RepID=SYL2_SULAC|nr:RecName: Full=Leucine--tRNA ligase 2; AltName: Full=Leucyl-tRNA synthetase 2; Short=LeuRS 2 [Sulfolobus acidocaldarius DSM 639]
MKISEKWQKEWENKRVFDATPDPNKKKFFTTIAFPYPNSPFHLGHGRTYVTGDIYARYMRMRGYNVLFPMAFHYTGTPIIAMADDVAKGDKELIDIFKSIYEIPDDVISKLVDPLFMANYFKEEIKQAMKEIGLSIDWRREFTTIDPEFSSFIIWQFRKLQEKGFIVRDTHPVGWCPVHHIPVGMHDTKGDMEPEIGEFVLIYFDSDMGILPVATLRPETVFGAIAVWVNPHESYSIVEIDGKKYVMSEKASSKLSFQIDNLKVITVVKGSELVKHSAVNPITGKEVPIIGANFVDPLTGTGVVMSVPAHAPFDYFYLKKTKSELSIISVIRVEGMGETLAKDLVEKSNPQNDNDLKKLTEQVYRIEYNKGVMIDITKLVKPEYVEELKPLVNLPVPAARQKITEFITQKGLGRKIYEIMNRPVYCRCGNEVVVKILKDQWFLDYGNQEWKDLARKSIESIRFIPPEIKKDFEFVVDWLQKRACARTRGLGTPLPWDKKWIIESLSDSTIYMAFYTIAHRLKEHKLKPSQLTYEFWEYIMLGNGNPDEISKISGIPVEVIKAMRDEFLYWYPLDVRHSGKDLVPNHLSFFIFNHAAIFPHQLWPKGIAVNGFVLYDGKKMSKSLRNIVPLRKAIRMYSPDVIRIALTTNADIGSDVNFSDSYAKSIIDTLKNYYDLLEKLKEFKGEDEGFPEKWLKSKFYQMVINVTQYMDSLDLRSSSNEILYNFSSYINEYFELVRSEGREPNGKLLSQILQIWIKLLSPFAPHFAEELWHKIGKNTLVSLESWPIIDQSNVDLFIDLTHTYHRKLLNDIQAILSVYKDTPKSIKIFVANKEFLNVLRDAINIVQKGGQLRQLMEIHKPKGKQDARLYQKIYEEAREIDDDMKKLVTNFDFDEKDLLDKGLKYLSYKLGIKEIRILDASEMDRTKYNKDALPLRPAIIIE